MAPRIQVYTDIACRALVGASTAPGIPENCGTSAVQARAAGIQASTTPSYICHPFVALITTFTQL